MELADRHLKPIFENIVVLLADEPGQIELFEPWASGQVSRLLLAARNGPASLAYEAEQIREELALLTPPPTIHETLTEHTRKMRLCQRQWLTGVLDFVDDLLDGATYTPFTAAA